MKESNNPTPITPGQVLLLHKHRFGVLHVTHLPKVSLVTLVELGHPHPDDRVVITAPLHHVQELAAFSERFRKINKEKQA